MKAQEFEAHAVWSALDTLQDYLRRDLHAVTDDDRYSTQRIHAMAELVDGIRDGDGTLVEPQVLNEMNQHLTQVNNSLDAYLNDPEGQRTLLAQASSSVSNLVTCVRAFAPLALPDEALRAAKAASTRYRNSLDTEVGRLKDEINDLQRQLRDAQEQRAGADADANQRLTDLSTTISSKSTEIDDLTVKLQAQIDEQRTAFEEEASSRASAFKSSQEAREQADAERIESAAEVTEQVRAKQEASGQEALDRLKQYQSQAAALVDTTSRHAITGDYKTWASHQATAAYWWTLAAVAIGLGTVAVLIYAVGSAADDSIQFTVYKTSISVVGLIIAGYAARQASEHRKEERTYKRLALDLAALEPFLEQLADPSTLREDIARRVFAPERTSGDPAEVRTRKGSLSIQELSQLVSIFRTGDPPD